MRTHPDIGLMIATCSKSATDLLQLACFWLCTGPRVLWCIHFGTCKMPRLDQFRISSQNSTCFALMSGLNQNRAKKLGSSLKMGV